MNVATLFIGWEMGLQYARHIGVIDAQEYEGRRAMGWDMLVRLGEKQRVVGEDEKPVELYMNAITEMLAQGSAYPEWKPGTEFRAIRAARLKAK